MPVSIPGNSSNYPTNITAPSAGDAGVASAIQTMGTQLADRTAHLNEQTDLLNDRISGVTPSTSNTTPVFGRGNGTGDGVRGTGGTGGDGVGGRFTAGKSGGVGVYATTGGNDGFAVYAATDVGNSTGVWAKSGGNKPAILAENSGTGGAVKVMNTLGLGPEIHFNGLTAAPASPAEGWCYYDKTLHKLRIWDGSAWQNCW